MRALSIRQPYAEQILRDTKKYANRSRATSIKEQVYIYASITSALVRAWESIGMQPGDLPENNPQAGWVNAF